MNSLTFTISPSLEQALRQMSEQAQLSKSELVRRALLALIAQRKRQQSAAQFNCREKNALIDKPRRLQDLAGAQGLTPRRRRIVVPTGCVQNRP